MSCWATRSIPQFRHLQGRDPSEGHCDTFASRWGDFRSFRRNRL